MGTADPRPRPARGGRGRLPGGPAWNELRRAHAGRGGTGRGDCPPNETRGRERRSAALNGPIGHFRHGSDDDRPAPGAGRHGTDEGAQVRRLLSRAQRCLPGRRRVRSAHLRHAEQPRRPRLRCGRNARDRLQRRGRGEAAFPNARLGYRRDYRRADLRQRRGHSAGTGLPGAVARAWPPAIALC